MLTDDFGVPSWRASYEAFGRAYLSSDPDGSIPTANPNLPFHIRFPGQYEDAESGLHYNRFRYYDAQAGRYISTDPIGQLGMLSDAEVSHVGFSPDAARVSGVETRDSRDANLFVYARSMPAVWKDPSGLQVKGDDPIYHQLVAAARQGNRQAINGIYDAAKAAKAAGQMSKARFNKVKGWVKLAKDGRLLAVGGVVPSTYHAFCAQHPDACAAMFDCE
jgi:RHS repeat-associated protein